MCALNVDGWLTTGMYGRTHYCGQWVSGLGWKTQHAWNHYDYSGDEEYLRQRAWPLMKEVAEFYMDYSRPNPQTGEIYIGPSGSPETGFECNGRKSTVDYGISMDQEIAHFRIKWHIRAEQHMLCAAKGIGAHERRGVSADSSIIMEHAEIVQGGISELL